jgi:AmmeMemoRadiSam system protein A
MIARKTLESYLKDKKKPEFDEKDESLKLPAGAFVTLTKEGQLRGCIGYIRPIKPLSEAISDMAIAAGTEDPRFSPVTFEELKNVRIEISVLSALAPVADVKDIVVGKHGLYIQRGYNSGLLLPQVPGEFDWNRDQFLENLCHKAGLPSDAWKDKETKLFSFTADVFHEE